jgi:peptide/nickel transport system permease protein
LKVSSIEEALFQDGSKLLQGKYELIIEGILFERGADLDARLVVYGRVHGWAGTDAERRDLSVALLWGTPIAIAFGLLAAVGTTVIALIISAFGSWFGGFLDAAIQRITEVNAMLPRLTFLIMIGIFYSRSIWVMLISIIVLSMFGLGIKTYRAIFLSLREAPYIEAARAYGAGNIRIIFRYMIPRVIPMLIPAFVTAIPEFVFLEASLAILGLGDPNLPTWGKLLFDAYSNEALFKGHYYWVLEPAAFLMITGMSFALVGFALDRIFNPRLRTG